MTDSWLNQRYQDAYFGLHGHSQGVLDTECSLCGEQASLPKEEQS